MVVLSNYNLTNCSSKIKRLTQWYSPQYKYRMTVVGVKLFLNVYLQFHPRSFGENIPDRVQRQQERVPPCVVDYLEDCLHDQLKFKTKQNQPLTPRQQVYKCPHFSCLNVLKKFNIFG